MRIEKKRDMRKNLGFSDTPENHDIRKKAGHPKKSDTHA